MAVKVTRKQIEIEVSNAAKLWSAARMEACERGEPIWKQWNKLRLAESGMRAAADKCRQLLQHDSSNETTCFVLEVMESLALVCEDLKTADCDEAREVREQARALINQLLRQQG